MTRTMTAVVLALSIAAPATADSLDGARAKLAEIRANRAHENATVVAPAATVVVTEAPKSTTPAPAASVAPGAPTSRVDMRKSLGPGRPELRTSGSFPYLGAPFEKQRYRVVIEEHAYQVGDIIRGAKIVYITEDHVHLSKDGDNWQIPAFMQ